MKKIVFIFAVLAVMSFTHYAFARNDGGTNGAGCVNNCGNSQEQPGGNGGQGGQGGAGGSALGVGVGIGVGIGNASASASSASAASSSAAATVNSSVSSAQSTSQSNNNSQNVYVQDTKQDYSDTYKKYTPTAVAPSINATTPCLIPISGAFGVPGLSVGGGSGVLDKGCEERELIRLGLASDHRDTWNLANTLLQARLAAVAQKDEEEAAAKAAPATFTWGNDYE